MGGNDWKALESRCDAHWRRATLMEARLAGDVRSAPEEGAGAVLWTSRNMCSPEPPHPSGDASRNLQSHAPHGAMCALGDASHHTGSCLVSPAKVEVLHAMAMMKTPQSGGSDAASAHAMSMVQTPCASEAPSPLAMSMVQTPRSGGSEAPSSHAVSIWLRRRGLAAL